MRGYTGDIHGQHRCQSPLHATCSAVKKYRSLQFHHEHIKAYRTATELGLISGLGQKQPLPYVPSNFRHAPSADIRMHDLTVSSGPRGDIPVPYSSRSSARETSEGVTVIPSALAVLRLNTNSSLVGCSTGRSAGLMPLNILSTKVAAR